MTKCQHCGGAETSIYLTSETITETLCLSCYNSRMAEELGVEAESYPEGVTIRDGEGRPHPFRLRKRLDPIEPAIAKNRLAGCGVTVNTN